MITREDILAFLASPDYRPLRRRGLAGAMAVPNDEYRAFRKVLDEMEAQGLVHLGHARRYRLAGKEKGEGEGAGADADDTGGLTGTYISKGDYGFFRPDAGGGEDYYIGRGRTGEAMNGDRVVVEPLGARGPRRSGRVVRVLERASSEVVGLLREGWGQPFVIPGERPEGDAVKITAPPGRSVDDFPCGHKVVARITRYPTRARGAEAELVADLGPAGTVETETAAVIREFGLRQEFPPEALAEAERLPGAVSDEELARRVDYREQRCMTIDPSDAADFDDAVFLEDTERGHRLYVHIADVGQAVPAGGALDAEARARSTSVYLPGRVLHMLPPRLSNQLCSLVPGRARPAQTAVVDFDRDGGQLGCRIERTVIRSALRLHYGQVRRALEGAPRPGEEIPEWAREALSRMRDLSQVLRARRFAAGSIFLDMPEIRVRVGSDGETLAVEERQQDFSHQLIEEFMLSANRAVAELLVSTEMPGLFRVHEPPDDDRLAELAGFVKTYGLNLVPPFSRRKLQRLVEQAREKPCAQTVMFAVLTSMKQARYSAVDADHFALAFRPYCHFTSPIRRYPDLVVHRALERLYPTGQPVIDCAAQGGRRRGQRALVADRREAAAKMSMLATHCSLMERNAADAERRLTRFRQLDLLNRHIEGEHHGVIMSVAEFGFFVRLDRFLVDGLVHESSLNDRYRFNARRQELQGQRTGRRWRAGDRVTVRIVRLDMISAKLDLELA